MGICKKHCEQFPHWHHFWLCFSGSSCFFRSPFPWLCSSSHYCLSRKGSVLGCLWCSCPCAGSGWDGVHPQQPALCCALRLWLEQLWYLPSVCLWNKQCWHSMKTLQTPNPACWGVGRRGEAMWPGQLF